MNRQAVRDPVILPTVIVVWAAVLLFVLYPLSRLLFLTFWNEGPSLDAVRGLLGDWTHRRALVNSLLLAACAAVCPGGSAAPSTPWCSCP